MSDANAAGLTARDISSLLLDLKGYSLGQAGEAIAARVEAEVARRLAERDPAGGVDAGLLAVVRRYLHLLDNPDDDGPLAVGAVHREMRAAVARAESVAATSTATGRRPAGAGAARASRRAGRSGTSRGRGEGG